MFERKIIARFERHCDTGTDKWVELATLADDGTTMEMIRSTNCTKQWWIEHDGYCAKSWKHKAACIDHWKTIMKESGWKEVV